MAEPPHSQEDAFELPAAEQGKSRFYFDIRVGAKSTADDEGLEFDGLDAAERAAVRAAAEIARDRLPNGEAREVTIEVRDRDDQRVIIVTVSMRVTRAIPLPLAPTP